MSAVLIDILVLVLLVCTALVIVRMRGILAAVMLTGIYSFLGACWMLLLDAPDVAFTEAAVGAGISTVLMLGTLSLVGTQAKEPYRSPWLPLAVVTVTGAALVYGTLDMPRYGDAGAPIHRYPDPSYIELMDPATRDAYRPPGKEGAHPPEMPNVVTAVLASYRGYDTLGETTVILTAGVAVLLLLTGGRRREDGGARGRTKGGGP